jgi:outer membrane cobalamin receptor
MLQQLTAWILNTMNTIKQLALLIILTVFTVQLANAQHIYKGHIADSNSNQSLEYACIRVNGKCFCTNRTGDFQVSLSSDTATLTITYVGYQTKVLELRSSKIPVMIRMDNGQVDLKEVVIAPSLMCSPFHTLSTFDLGLRPVNSAQDLMRLVPGLFVAQHMGGGKAEQIFVRGFDADHGTDLNVSVDGMPVNMVSHIHGQGYADLHFLIPETVKNFDFGKGPYYSAFGDLATAGYLSYTTKDAIDRSMISLEGGQFNSFRVAGLLDLLEASDAEKGRTAYIAGEYNYTDGAFKLPEHYKRLNLFGKYSQQIGANNKLTLSASTFSTSWRASGEIPERVVAANTVALDEQGNPVRIPAAPITVDRFAAIDSAQGGQSTRVNAIARLTSNLGNDWAMENQLYYTHYTFSLHVNSTFFEADSVSGDERQQAESRDMFGYNGKISKRKYWGNTLLTSVVGLTSRFDRTYGSVYDHVTQHYQFVNNITQGDIRQNNTGLYLDETLESDKWQFNAGLRMDYFKFNYHDSTKNSLLLSPKLNIQYTPDEQLQFYLKMGKGFHSNNAVAVIGMKGLETIPSAYGVDLGLNWKPMPRLFVNAAAWYLYLSQEFVYTDDGDIVPGGKTKRTGIDLSARYQLAKWLFADLNVNVANPRFADSTKSNGYLPLAPTFTSTGGLDFKFKNGINGGLSYRNMHTRPGNNTNTLIAKGYFVTDLKINYSRKRYEVGITIENLLNKKWNEYAVEQVSRLRTEPAAVDQMSFTPGTPFFAKVRVAFFF